MLLLIIIIIIMIIIIIIRIRIQIRILIRIVILILILILLSAYIGVAAAEPCRKHGVGSCALPVRPAGGGHQPAAGGVSIEYDRAFAIRSPRSALLSPSPEVCILCSRDRPRSVLGHARICRTSGSRPLAKSGRPPRPSARAEARAQRRARRGAC